MSKCKKILAVVMAMVLVVSMMPMVIASAAVERILRLDTPCELMVDNTGADFEFVPEQDGWYSFYCESNYDTDAVLYDSEWETIEIGTDTDDFNFDFYLEAKLYAGQTYHLDVDVIDIEEGDKVGITVFATEAVVIESAQVIQEPYDTTCVEGYEYDTIKFDGLVVRFTYSDGTTVDWEYEEESEIDSKPVSVLVYEDEGNFYYDVDCGNAHVRGQYEVVENPVKSLELKNPLQIAYYGQSMGFTDVDTGDFYYSENIPASTAFVVNYKDGTSEELNYDESNLFEYADTQSEELWVVGNDYTATVSYLGVGVDIPVHIYECPFTDITLNSTPQKKYVFGDGSYGMLDEDGYYMYPREISGLSFTATYADGTTQTFDDDDLNLDETTIDGYLLDIEAIVCEQPGTYTVSVNYKGFEFSYDIEVVDDPLSGLGDADGDGKVTVMDATLIQRSAAGVEEFIDLVAADVDEDGAVSVIDATIIQRFVAGYDINI